MQLIVETNETPARSLIRNLAEEPSTLAPAAPNNQIDGCRGCLAGALPVTCELNGEPMDGETLAAEEDLPITDELIVDLVLKALHASPYGRMRHLQAYCDNGRVTLQGRLPTYYLKQVAQVLIDSVPGVRDIDNDVSVFSPR